VAGADGGVAGADGGVAGADGGDHDATVSDTDAETPDACVAVTWYRDIDGDTVGDANVTTEACEQPDGYVADAGDCDDTDDRAYPGATEVRDNVDNDCDGFIDEGLRVVRYADSDNDGFGGALLSLFCPGLSGLGTTNSTDCNDNNATAYPGATELCGDGVDNDCDSSIDENFTSTSVFINTETDYNAYRYCAALGTIMVNTSSVVGNMTFPNLKTLGTLNMTSTQVSSIAMPELTTLTTLSLANTTLDTLSMAKLTTVATFSTISVEP
jgi:hypothetical protein